MPVQATATVRVPAAIVTLSPSRVTATPAGTSASMVPMPRIPSTAAAAAAPPPTSRA